MYITEKVQAWERPRVYIAHNHVAIAVQPRNCEISFRSLVSQKEMNSELKNIYKLVKKCFT